MNDTMKRWFIAMAPMVSIGVLVHAIAVLASGAPWLPWTGTAVAAATFPITFGWMFFSGVTRTSPVLPGFLALVGGGTVLSAAGVATTASGVLPVVEAGLCLAIFAAYVFWYSTFDRVESDRLAPGRALPDFSVEDADGNAITRDDLLGQPLLLLFFRGNWCPFCMAQIREIAEQYRELEARGVSIVAISPQSHDKTRQLADRFDVPMQFCSDPDRQAAQALGIEQDNGVPAGMEILGYEADSVYPTVVITDAEGTITWADQTDSYRIRPEPATFLRVLDGERPEPESRAPVAARAT